MRTAPSVSVSSRGAQRIHARHPWVYRSDLGRIDAGGGDTVRVLDPRDRLLGTALYSERSQIALRMMTWGEAPAGLELWRARIARAVGYRESLGIDATAYRVVHGEGDLLPSLIVDRYGEYLVVQALSQGVDRLLPDIVAILVEQFRPLGILARNDPKVRALEGLEQHVTVLYGEVPQQVGVREGPVRYEVDLRRGQKTGLFLDQRENHEAAARYASGRVLDAFSYQGGFALRLAPQCDHVVTVDISDESVTRTRENAALNGLTNVDARAGNVFDELRELARGDERFNMVVLDPPAFAKSKGALPKALGGYKEINLRALKLLRPGGYLVTCTCSYHVDEATFGQVLYEAAVDAGVQVAVVEKRMQGRDHPVVLGVPETYYLKCLILRRLA